MLLRMGGPRFMVVRLSDGINIGDLMNDLLRRGLSDISFVDDVIHGGDMMKKLHEWACECQQEAPPSVDPPPVAPPPAVTPPQLKHLLLDPADQPSSSSGPSIHPLPFAYLQQSQVKMERAESAEAELDVGGMLQQFLGQNDMEDDDGKDVLTESDGFAQPETQSRSRMRRSRSCTQCGMQVRSDLSRLIQHINQHHTTLPERWRCSQCEHTAHARYHLRLHITNQHGGVGACLSNMDKEGETALIHYVEEFFPEIEEESVADSVSCKLCGKEIRKSAERSGLVRHSMIHLPLSVPHRYKCAHCNLSNHVRGHIRAHYSKLHPGLPFSVEDNMDASMRRAHQDVFAACWK